MMTRAPPLPFAPASNQPQTPNTYICRRIHQQLEGLWAAMRSQRGYNIETAEALKAALDGGCGEPWHVIIGPDAFVTNVRFRKERCVGEGNTTPQKFLIEASAPPFPPTYHRSIVPINPPHVCIHRCFIYVNKRAALQALVFQSSPLPPLDAPPSSAVTGGGKR